MKLTELTLTNFRSHTKTVLKDLQSVNILTGPNGAGKSTVLDAIGYSLTGVCRGLDDGGKGAKQLTCDLPGAPKAATSVTFTVAGKEPMSRGLDQGPRSATHTKIISKLGLDEQVLQLIEGGLVELDLGEHRDHLLGHLPGGAGQALGEAGEPAALFG